MCRKTNMVSNVSSLDTLFQVTLNSGFFVRVLFSRNFMDTNFCENKTLVKWQIHSGVY